MADVVIPARPGESRMRLGRSVLAGLVAGVVAGFVVALLRPRGTHPAVPVHQDLPPGSGVAPLIQPCPGTPGTGPDPCDDVPVPPTAQPLVPPMMASREPVTPVPGSRRSQACDDDGSRTHD